MTAEQRTIIETILRNYRDAIRIGIMTDQQELMFATIRNQLVQFGFKEIVAANMVRIMIDGVAKEATGEFHYTPEQREIILAKARG